MSHKNKPNLELANAQQAAGQRVRRELPFKTRPKAFPPRIVGDETSGTIEIPIYGSLTVGENLDFLTLVRREDVKQTIETVNKNSEDGVKVDEDSLVSLDLAYVMGQYNVEAATIILRGRIDPEWTVDDTRELSPLIVSQTAAIMQEELASAGGARRKEQEENKEADAGDVLDPTSTQTE